VRPGLVVVATAARWLNTQVQRLELATFVGSSSLLADFGITAAGAGLLVGIYFPMYGLMQIPSGILADTGNPKRIALVAGALTGLTTVALAAAPTLPLAILARAATGVASGFIWLSSLKLYSRLPGVSYPRAVGTLVAVGSAGTVLGLLAVPAAVAFWPWRVVALLTAAPPVVACLALALTPAPRAGPRRTPEAERCAGERRSFVALLRQSLAGVRRVAGTPEYWVLFLPTMLWNGANFAIVGWLPRYARDALGLPLTAVGLLPALMAAGQMAGSLLAGTLQSRRGAAPGPAAGGASTPASAVTARLGGWTLARRGRRLRRAPDAGRSVLPVFFGCIASYGVLFTLLLTGAVAPLGAGGSAVAALLMGMVYGTFFLSQVYLAERVEPALLGTATGVLNGLGFLPAFVYPWAMGLLMDAVDQPPTPDWTYSAAAYRTAFLLVDAGIAAGLLGAWLIARRGRRAAAQPPAGR
jgi:MFS family permease